MSSNEPRKERDAANVSADIRAMQRAIKGLCDCQIRIIDILIANAEQSCDRWKAVQTATRCGDSEQAVDLIGDLASREVEAAQKLVVGQNELKLIIGKMVAQSDAMETQYPWLSSSGSV